MSSSEKIARRARNAAEFIYKLTTTLCQIKLFEIRIVFRIQEKQCCQMAYFQNKNPDLGKFWRVLHGRCWYIIWPICLLYAYLAYFVAIWCIYVISFGLFYQEKIWQP
jgi:hypothetical protein